MDYFSFIRKQVGMSDTSHSPWSAVTPSPRSPTPALSSPTARSSWSSLFTTNHVKRLVAPETEKIKEDEGKLGNSRPASAVPIPVTRTQSHSPKARNFRKDSPLHQTAISNSWSDNKSTMGRHPRRPTFSQVVSHGNTPTLGKRIVFEPNQAMEAMKQYVFIFTFLMNKA